MINNFVFFMTFQYLWKYYFLRLSQTNTLANMLHWRGWKLPLISSTLKIRIFCTNVVISSDVWLGAKNLYKKRARKTLMKFTPAGKQSRQMLSILQSSSNNCLVIRLKEFSWKKIKKSNLWTTITFGTTK